MKGSSSEVLGWVEELDLDLRFSKLELLSLELCLSGRPSSELVAELCSLLGGAVLGLASSCSVL